MIAANYDIVTETLDLGGSLKETSLISILDVIRDCVFFGQMEHLILRDNQFKDAFNSDTVRLPDFPPNLKILDLSNNELSGPSFPWDQLPSKLETLYLQNNRLGKSIDWLVLPKELRILWLFGNQFEGSIAWPDLPIYLISLEVDNLLADTSTDPTSNLGWYKKQARAGNRVMFTKTVQNYPNKYPFDTFGIEQAAAKNRLRKKAAWALGTAKFMHLMVPLIFIAGLLMHIHRSMVKNMPMNPPGVPPQVAFIKFEDME